MLSAVLLVLAVGAVASIVWSTLRYGIGPVPTSRAVRREVLALVDADTRGAILELGAGWGGLARALARRCPHARVHAIEASLVPYAWMALVQRVAPLPNMTLERADFTKRALDDADVIVAYLWTGGMRALAAARVKPGATIVASTFALPGHTPETTVRARDTYASPVYRYRTSLPEQHNAPVRA